MMLSLISRIKYTGRKLIDVMGNICVEDCGENGKMWFISIASHKM